MKVDFGNGYYPSTDLTVKQLEELYLALYYQLNERISFVRPKDKIVAQLLFELGNVELLLDHNSDAQMDFVGAALYGFEGDLFNDRIKLAHGEKPKEPALNATLFGIGAIVLLVLIAMIVFLLRSKPSYGEEA